MKKIISALLILTMLVSMVCVNASAAGIRLNMNFESMDAFLAQFRAGEFYVEDSGVLYGYSGARSLESSYNYDEDLGLFKNELNTWLTYDATITLSASDDDMTESDRWVNLIYCNDNPKYYGQLEQRLYMAFSYDIQNRCFRFTTGWDNTDAEGQLLDPVYMEIDTEGEDFFTMGISVDKDRIRCFYGDKLIFDFVDSAREYFIADTINSCFLFWQDGNFIQVNNITVADAGYLFPYADEPAVSENTTTAGGNDIADNTGKAPDAETSATTTRIESEVVTDEKGETSIVTKVITEATTPKAETNVHNNGGSSASTGDSVFAVVLAMVATLGCAIVVKKVSVR